MPGLGQIALNSAPIFGGAMLAIAAGQFKGPDFRALIRQDMDLLDRLPADATKGAPTYSAQSMPALTT